MSAQYPSVVPSLLDRDLGDEYLVYDRESGRIHVLNPTARWIVECCDGSRTVAEIAERVAAHFEIDLDRAHSDTEELLADLGERGVITFSGPAERSA